jgi:DNA primase
MHPNFLQEKISSISEELQQQVMDYVDFLIERYTKEVPLLTDEEKLALEKRYNDYKNNYSQALEVEEVRDRLDYRLQGSE